MASMKKKEGSPRWSPPAAADIKPGDRLHYYSIERDFEFEVMDLKHGGEWIFGYDDVGKAKGLGPIAVPRKDCMTPQVAAKVLDRLPRLSVADPVEAVD